MSLSISSQAPYIQFNNQPPGTTTQTTSAPTTQSQMGQDTLEAGFFKKTGDAIGNFFSDIADSMKFGKTYKLIEQEFRQVDRNGDNQLNFWEFTAGTIQPFHFNNADRNLDQFISLNEYVDYRKKSLDMAFAQKEVSGDRFLNHTEIGVIGRQLLLNRDVRVDPNQDGMMNKREFMRANLTLGISIRDALGF